MERLGFLGTALDPDRSARTDGGDADISGASCATSIVVVSARADLIIAGQVRAVLRAG